MAPDRFLHPLLRRRALEALARRRRPSTVLVVCHGNICRSPFAAALLERELGAEGVRVESAGLMAADRPCPKEAVAEAARYGVDLTEHRSTPLTAERVQAAELIVVMDPAQERTIRGRFGRRARHIVVLGDLDPQSIANRTIVDPVFKSREVFEACYARIERCVGVLKDIFSNGAWTMPSRTIVASVIGVLAFVLVAGCSDTSSTTGRAPTSPTLAVTSSSGITLDRSTGIANDAIPYGNGGTHVGQGFTPTNPHLGDAIVATFFWRGSINTIAQVTDHLCDVNATPVGNAYTLVDYETAGGMSMATYVATNVQGFPDPNPTNDQALCVHAIFSNAITEGGVALSAWSGVSPDFAQALGAHQGATGIGTTTTIADPGAVTVGAGSMVYGLSIADGVVPADRPAGFTNFLDVSDTMVIADGEYLTPAPGGSIDPQWAWHFSSPHTWIATVLSLQPAALHLVFTTQPSTTAPFMTITPPVRATVVDGQGAPVTGFSGTVTIAIGHNGGMVVPGTLSGTKTVTVSNGVATFSDLSIDQPGGGYTLVVSGAGLAGAESTPFNVGVM